MRGIRVADRQRAKRNRCIERDRRGGREIEVQIRDVAKTPTLRGTGNSVVSGPITQAGNDGVIAIGQSQTLAALTIGAGATVILNEDLFPAPVGSAVAEGAAPAGQWTTTAFRSQAAHHPTSRTLRRSPPCPSRVRSACSRSAFWECLPARAVDRSEPERVHAGRHHGR